MKKKLPRLPTDKAAEDFVATADLTDYDLSRMTPMHFEFQPKDRSITMRLSESLFEAIREEADRSGMPYQRFIRKALEEAVHQPSGT
ncbi:MAG: hypothetical protein AW11_03966 [Candidatus Accumulibacter regalis]|jgi:predicted DNA binding CopG/RHH family protein|uniref:Uncharacterized protein n=1 Tax=Accumulibacter regalis TaxID=522306 RepID=A0A011P945_ACCRE|nr:BrnA antitoxin family protein [Accumulibacter sp.]EXI84101.1 MAG: hypothetical protein AW11_03966 [Candidatus Accumulibacter regalis]HRE72705.1 BrnA antitoxin family protein [Accumulibacter sp.]